jgi:hypothetical protein
MRRRSSEMANWNALRSYVKSNYNIADDNLDSLRLIFDTGSGRSQVVFVSKIGDTGWAQVSTAVCEESQINPRDALIRNSQMTVGGLALVDGGPVIFRHAFPLADLDPAEFEIPLGIAVNFGDELERELTGADRF